MKYTDCIPGKIYRTWFRDRDYWVIEFKEANTVNYFIGKGIYIGGESSFDSELNGLAHFTDNWKFSEPSESDLQAFYKKYNNIIIYEIY